MKQQTDGGSVLEQLRRIFPDLNRLGPGTWVVGGAVRDILMGRDPVDIDLACHDAESAARSFARATRGSLVELGRRFATWRVVVGGCIYDFNEIVGVSVESDLMRRDFTINAIAVQAGTGSLVDLGRGSEDLQRRLLRMVQKVNFAEDPLRVLKGVRMAVALDLTIDPPTMQAMHQYASAVAGVAAERVSAELDAILTEEERTRGLVLLNELGLDQLLFGFSLSPDMIEAVALSGGRDATVAYAVLFFNRDPKSIDEFSSRWRWGERQRRQTADAIEMARRVLAADRGDLPVLIYDFGLESARRAIQVLYAFERDRGADALGEILESRGEGIAMLRPLLEGERIQEATGISPGPEVGRLKRAMMEAHLRGEISTPAEATELVKRLAAGGS